MQVATEKMLTHLTKHTLNFSMCATMNQQINFQLSVKANHLCDHGRRRGRETKHRCRWENQLKGPIAGESEVSASDSSTFQFLGFQIGLEAMLDT